MVASMPNSPQGLRRMGSWPPNTFLGSLKEETRERFLSLGTATQIASDETLILEGDRGNRDVYLIMQGFVRVVRNTADGKVVVLAIRSDGDLVGELAAFDGGPRVASVVSVGSCFVRKIGHRDFREFLLRHPDAMLAAQNEMSAKLRHATWQRSELGTATMLVRVARMLIELAGRYGIATPSGIKINSLTQANLAAMIYSTESSVYKVFKYLRGENIIETGYGNVVIRDMPALRREAKITEIPPEYGVRPPSDPQSDEG